MDPPGSLRWDTDLADAPEPIEQCPHKVGLRCCRGIPQPGEWRRRECRIGYEQRVEFSKLRRGKVRQQSICSPLACPSPPCNGGALDNPPAGRGKNFFRHRKIAINRRKIIWY